ncbi:MAG TPA: hypothetical protein DEA08_21830 [Planctomycetes bacterium]|nr:hypothetical protein [Planctomycetota bacterium]
MLGVLRVGSTPSAHEHYVVRPVDPASESLEERVARSGAQGVHEALRIALAVGEALAYGHERGCLHHALRPACVWLGPGDEVRVGDFGRTTSLLGLSFDGEGKPTGFSPPELGKVEALDVRVDVYSLGVVLYLLVCGRDPFEGLDSMQRLTGHGRIAPPDPALGPDLRAVLAKLLAPDVEERYLDAAAALVDLRALSEGRPLVLAPAVPSALWTAPPPAAPVTRGWWTPLPTRNLDVVPTGLGLAILGAVIGAVLLVAFLVSG